MIDIFSKVVRRFEDGDDDKVLQFKELAVLRSDKEVKDEAMHDAALYPVELRLEKRHCLLLACIVQ